MRKTTVVELEHNPGQTTHYKYNQLNFKHKIQSHVHIELPWQQKKKKNI